MNPSRGTAPAVFVGGWAIDQLWAVWVAPILGGIIAGVVYYRITDARADMSSSAPELKAKQPA
ncbi:MAG: aquaporin [Acidobacteria bacterium]|nr:aquaporin [Acidobacteriota bacterium]